MKLLPLLSLSFPLLMSCSDVKHTLDQNKKPTDVRTCISSLHDPITLKGGPTRVGSDKAYPEEGPQRPVVVMPFEIDVHEVTNHQFSTFVTATGYITDAEKSQPGFGVPGGAVFSQPSADNPTWWHFVEGANWRNPEGPESTIDGRDFHPVVQVTLKDAQTYANWAGRRLPSEIEWEYAAKAGSSSLYVWGDKPDLNGRKANTWQGTFPIQNTAMDGFDSRAPVGCFEANAFGLFDMIGNVWEWTDTKWEAGQSNVIKGGSFLCAENYCRRYRASARQPQDVTLSTNHIGFRTVR